MVTAYKGAGHKPLEMVIVLLDDYCYYGTQQRVKLVHARARLPRMQLHNMERHTEGKRHEDNFMYIFTNNHAYY